MMRALWAGVTGLQAHQIAMDVESNNIANVNTTGYKYSRANFSNILNQTVSIATAPQGDLGGQNAMQIGLGTQVSTITKIFEQGSIETTDKDTDLAISGDGFFVVSPDGGTTYKYTRNGDFAFDANGNFVDSNGYIIQGWLRDSDTGEIDTTSPISNITIPPGLTTPANATSVVTVKANLDSGDSVGTNKTTIYALDKYNNGYDADGNGTISTDEVNDENDTGLDTFDSDKSLIERGLDFGVLFNTDGDAFNLNDGQGAWISYQDAEYEFNVAVTAGVNTYDINFELNGTLISGTYDESAQTTPSPTDEEFANRISTLINAQSSLTGITAKTVTDTTTGLTSVVLSNDNSTGTTESTKNIKITNINAADNTGITTAGADLSVITAYQYAYSETPQTNSFSYSDSDIRYFTTTEDLRAAMQDDVRENVDYDGNGLDAAHGSDAGDDNSGATITVNSSGQYVISNANGTEDLYLTITNLTGTNISANESFVEAINSLQGTILAGNTSIRTTESIYAATLASSTDVYDSLGSKHTIRFEYTKTGFTDTGGTQWSVNITVPEPGEISITEPKNIVTGTISFNSNGSVATYTPRNITYTANNGSEANQNIQLDFGTAGQLDGITSFDKDSSTSGISQDGYAGGDLNGISVDETGTIIGSFTNGRSFGLAQVAMSTFNNNSGLESDGGNCYIQTSNSGDPVFGQANTGGKGSIQASSLEMSNVDLSRSLTQLIVIQRGYQANSKTITTADEMLNTLLQLK